LRDNAPVCLLLLGKASKLLLCLGHLLWACCSALAPFKALEKPLSIFPTFGQLRSDNKQFLLLTMHVQVCCLVT
jgi:hypothetical protein